MFAELKHELSTSKHLNDALTQISDGLYELRSLQEGRDRECAFISDARIFQAFARTNVRGVDKILTTGPLPLFTPDEPHVSAGFVSLVNLLATPAKVLGFPPDSTASVRLPILPDGFLSDGALIVPHRIGRRPKPDIFRIDQVRTVDVASIA